MKPSTNDQIAGKVHEVEVQQILYASDDELRRVAAPTADPQLRWHYRYVAAEMGWHAAELLPDNTDAKARILCEAGSWIKYLHPEAADRFYKELVRKCRKTAIGSLADSIRWFPLLDENGELRGRQPASHARRRATEGSTASPPPEAVQPSGEPDEPAAPKEPEL